VCISFRQKISACIPILLSVPDIFYRQHDANVPDIRFVLILNYRWLPTCKPCGAHPLTGILNRRSLEDEAGYLLARCERNNEIMTL